jgi:Fic family protein
VLKDINFIDRHVGGSILAHDSSLPSEERRRCMARSLLDEAISSSQIEGAATSRVAAKEMLRTGRRPRDRSERMIFNNYEGLQMIKRHLQEPLTTDLILALHARTTGDTLEDTSWEGRFRRASDRAMHVLDSDDQTVLYEPPDAAGIADSMRGLCEFANSGSRDEFVNPVIKAILLHFWLAYVHPFMDGNGPVARALFYWYLLKHRYWGFEYLSVSTAILSDRMQYYRSFLHTERDGNDATYFIVYNLKQIRRAIEILDEYIREKQKAKKQAYRLSEKYSSVNPRQRMLLASAIEKPDEVYAIETHANVHAITYQTARTDLLGLESLGLLTMSKDGKKFIFTPVPDLKQKLEE